MERKTLLGLLFSACDKEGGMCSDERRRAAKNTRRYVLVKVHVFVNAFTVILS